MQKKMPFFSAGIPNRAHVGRHFVTSYANTCAIDDPVPNTIRRCLDTLEFALSVVTSALLYHDTKAQFSKNCCYLVKKKKKEGTPANTFKVYTFTTANLFQDSNSAYSLNVTIPMHFIAMTSSSIIL